MATRTENIKLIKPDLDDDADIRVINGNMDIIDGLFPKSNPVVYEQDLQAHDTSDSAHADIRNKIDTDITTHNTAGDAHADKFNAKADKLVNGRGVVRSINGVGADSNGNVDVNTFAVGDIKWSSADLTQVGFLVANGAEVGRATYPDLCAVYEAMGFPWGAGDGSNTFNLPNLIGKFAEGANSAGGYRKAGLPNITGYIGDTYVGNQANGAFYGNAGSSTYISHGSGRLFCGVNMDASKSNAIYGNSTTVQPNSALLIPYVKAFNGASADSTDLAISEVANDVARLSANIVGKNECKSYVVESVVNEDGSWYRKYSDGWLEQGGIVLGVSGYNNPVTFLKPFKDAKYNLQANHYITMRITSASGTAPNSMLYDVACLTARHTNTGFYFVFTNSTADCYKKWFACGMGAE